MAITIVDAETGRIAEVKEPDPESTSYSTFTPTGSDDSISTDQIDCGDYSYDASFTKIAGIDAQDQLGSGAVPAYLDVRTGKVVDLEAPPQTSDDDFATPQDSGVALVVFDNAGKDLWWYDLVTHQDESRGLVYDSIVIVGPDHHKVSYPLANVSTTYEGIHFSFPAQGSAPTLVVPDSQKPGSSFLLTPDGEIKTGRLPDPPERRLPAKLLPQTPYHYLSIRPSTDGKRAALVATKDYDHWSVWTVPSSGGNPVKLADLPDGRKYLDVARYGAILTNG